MTRRGKTTEPANALEDANKVEAISQWENKALEHNSAAARALAILQVIAEANDPVTAQQIAPKLDLPHPTVHRLAVQLEELGFLQRAPGSKRFVGGAALQALALNALINSSWRGERHAILQALARQVEETCNVTVLDGNEVVYIDRVEAHWPLRTHLQAGSRVPLHCGASGKVFLSFMPKSKQQGLLTAAPLPRYTEKTIVDTKALTLQLKQIRKTKVAYDDQEFMSGLIGIAVPVFDSKDRVCATVSMHAPTVRWTIEGVRKLVPHLTAAAQAITRTLEPKPTLGEKN